MGKRRKDGPSAPHRDVDPSDSPEAPWPPPSHGPVRVTFVVEGLAPRYRVMVEQACAIWTDREYVRLEAVRRSRGTGNEITVRQRRRAWLQPGTDGEFRGEDRDGHREGGTLTLYTRLLDRASDNGALATVVHEMGHALGLMHRNDPTDVMHAETDDETDPRPDAVDRENLRRMYGTPNGRAGRW